MAKKDDPGTKTLRKGRYSQINGNYLITLVTNERVPWFTKFDLACIMCRCLSLSSVVTDMKILCWVVMPDHVHFLVELHQDDLSSVIRRMKAGSATRLNRQIGRKGRFWQPGFHDRCLRHEDNIKDVARYIIGNPLRSKLCRKYGDYPFWDAVWL